MNDEGAEAMEVFGMTERIDDAVDPWCNDEQSQEQLHAGVSCSKAMMSAQPSEVRSVVVR